MNTYRPSRRKKWTGALVDASPIRQFLVVYKTSPAYLAAQIGATERHLQRIKARETKRCRASMMRAFRRYQTQVLTLRVQVPTSKDLETANQRTIGRRSWDNPRTAAKMVAHRRSPEMRAMASATYKRLWGPGGKLRKTRTKLTPQKVRNIRRLHEAGYSYAEIAERFGVCSSTVGHVVKRVTWAHVE